MNHANRKFKRKKGVGQFDSKRSADLSGRSAAFSFKFSPSHRLVPRLRDTRSMVSPYRPCCSAASEANPDALVHLAESGVRAYLTVMDRNPEAVEKAFMNKS